MVTYTCVICNKIFDNTTSYKRHKDRKNTCLSIEETQIKKTNELEEKNNKLEEKFNKYKIKMNEKNNKYEEKINEYKNEIKELKLKLKEKINKDNSKMINSNIDIDNNNVVIKINEFGKENMDFNVNDVESILSKGTDSVLEFIKLLHFNENKPENHNVYISNMKYKKNVLIYNGQNWIIVDIEKILDDMIFKGMSFIKQCYDEMYKKKKRDNYILQNFNKTNKLIDDVFLILYNYRRFPIETRKKLEKYEKTKSMNVLLK